jgi:biotin transport system substrate-specific component
MIEEALGRASRARSRAILDIVGVLAWAYVVAISAQIRLTVPFSPVPVTAQTLAVLLGGALLGMRRGTLATAAYLAGGAMGLPFFAGGTPVGPTGGYLVGFVAASSVVGALVARGWGRRPLTAFAAVLLGNLVIYLFGLPWLAVYVGWGSVLSLGLLPFVVGDLAKALCASGVIFARFRG